MPSSDANGCDPEVNGQRPSIGKDWSPAQPGDVAFRSNCDDCAKQIRDHVGGVVVTATPRPPARLLGADQGVNLGWRYHTVVVKDGRVFDAFTGAAGLTIADYKALWQYADAIDFGF